MAESRENIYHFKYTAGSSSFGVSMEGDILVNGKDMAHIRKKKSSQPPKKTKSQPQTEETDSIACEYQAPIHLDMSEVKVAATQHVLCNAEKFEGIFSGTPMMSLHRTQSDPWPVLENNVHIFRSWLLCIVDDESDSPLSRAQLLDADFFDCSQEPLLRDSSGGGSNKLPQNIVESIEAVQELGKTSCSNDAVESFRE
ncbi:hypothetical protein HYALB_00013543 [Hymenoscyphus albidus]|uniref:Uncharacterized protein n=1 Tax=Hymenoscyphus albidus TaxID=595503 RepID=A0A9N9Q569_9HELO|nr:hypothetical protein HYALB_00013543 [Hymenoscyphus albidus]